MVNTKNAQLRCQILDNCFGRYASPCTFKQLKGEVGEVFLDFH